MFLTTPIRILPSSRLPEGVALLLRVLLFEDGLAREHDVAALLVDLDHAHAQLLALEAVQVAHGADVDLAAGQERAHADVDGEAALDALDHTAGDDAALHVGALDVVPHLHLLGLLAREHDVAVAVLGLLEQDVDAVADLDRDLAVLVAELLDGDDALGLVADVDDHLGSETCSTMPARPRLPRSCVKLTSYMSSRRSYSSVSLLLLVLGSGSAS
jgi:hypothetical protein